MTKKRFKNEKFNNLAVIEHQFKAEVNEDANVSNLTIYGDIGESWWGESTSASDVEKALKSITSDTINVFINSGGGDAFDGIAIYNQLKNHPAKVIVHVDGLAASAASLIAMAADDLVMNIGSMLMIHEASTIAWGTKSDIQKTLNALEGIDKSIADIYMTRYTGEREEIVSLIEAESWLTAGEAVELGLADRVNEKSKVVDPEEVKNVILSKFRNKNTPQHGVIAASVTQSSTKNILDQFKRNSNE
ncbi:head maturation protease, ClpP-related [Paenisporosarcina macmurdoensis]|uniref:ATP-dependent Clp protease proteolytic subunit n=1 Tax=Paenisporosarcina macmurdoensis TaxID=212659 RepID=A0ABW1L5G0_9BACL